MGMHGTAEKARGDGIGEALVLDTGWYRIVGSLFLGWGDL